MDQTNPPLTYCPPSIVPAVHLRATATMYISDRLPLSYRLQQQLVHKVARQSTTPNYLLLPGAKRRKGTVRTGQGPLSHLCRTQRPKDKANF